jgi:hypothetical protein
MHSGNKSKSKSHEGEKPHRNAEQSSSVSYLCSCKVSKNTQTEINVLIDVLTGKLTYRYLHLSFHDCSCCYYSTVVTGCGLPGVLPLYTQ